MSLPAQVTMFPKICSVHRVAAKWEDDHNPEALPGWRCPECPKGVCPIHRTRLSPGIAGVYCRGCRRTWIMKSIKPARHEISPTGVAWIWRVP